MFSFFFIINVSPSANRCIWMQIKNAKVAGLYKKIWGIIKLINNILSFNTKCRKLKVFPSCITIKYKNRSTEVIRAKNFTKLIWLNNEIKSHTLCSTICICIYSVQIMKLWSKCIRLLSKYLIVELETRLMKFHINSLSNKI